MSDVVYVLVGHGAAPSDVPRPLVQRLKALEGQRRAAGGAMSDEERELDRQIRHWPRSPATDPYQAGMESIAAHLRARVGRVVVTYNEFCAPSLDEGLTTLADEGVRDIKVVTTMVTPGGVHAEVEIPETLREFSEKHPDVHVRYAWPFDLEAVAALLAGA